MGARRVVWRTSDETVVTHSTARILTINTGSSSLKAALFAVGEGEPARRWSLRVERIGGEDGQRSVAMVGDATEVQVGGLPDHAAALGWLIDELDGRGLLAGITAVGHRVVHGGADYVAPQAVSGAMLTALRALVPIDPSHLPQAIAAIEAVAGRLPALPQVACFDTYFHAGMPTVATLLPLPRWLADEGVRRFGFHGLSYESIMAELERVDPGAARGRVVVAHLGSGASMAAVLAGRGVDTTMGYTPTGGLMMGSRPGDLDPGLLLYLLQVRGMSPDAIGTLLSRESGLLGVSGTSQDLRDLLAAEASDPRAREAVDLYCHIAKKHLAALAATLGGLDTLVFTGGVGEHAAPVRERICAGLGFLGVQLDPARNRDGAAVVSSDGGPVTIRVMRADEELTIARHTARLISPTFS